MPEWIKTIITIATGFIVGFWAHHLTIRRESEKRRHAFREKLRQLEFKLQTLDGPGWIEAYKSSVDEVRNAAASVYEDIPSGKSEAFTKAWRAYCDKDNQAIRPTIDLTMEKYLTGVFPDLDFGAAKAVIYSRLRALINTAS